MLQGIWVSVTSEDGYHTMINVEKITHIVSIHPRGGFRVSTVIYFDGSGCLAIMETFSELMTRIDNITHIRRDM